ncbi:MAG: response regulator [Planctomycetota bacterium]|nr:MAG: response regulator [Planctomycetota bacterium]
MTARRVVVIDDKHDSVWTLKRVLELSGHDVEVAYDGEGGIAKAREFSPEVVLCDIGLPGDTDGYAVARTLRGDQEFSSCLMIAITGYGRDEDARKAAEAGFDLHMTKPVDAIALAKLVSDHDAQAS